jgi:hypothetical protein
MDWNIADPDLRSWLAGATSADIELALQVGWRNVSFARACRSTVVMGKPTDVPVQRGQIGEEMVESIVRERFNDVTNMTKVPKSGDITLWIGGRKIIIEVKNYTNPVPTGGVEKFRRDLSTAGASGGVFVSLQSMITGITGDFKIQLEPVDGRTVPCAYIVSSDRAQIITAVSMCIHFASSMLGVARELQSRDEILGVVRSLTTHIDELAGARNNMQRELADASERAIKNSSCIMSTEVKLREDVEKLQGELCEKVIHGGDNVCAGITAYDKMGTVERALVDTVVRAVNECSGDPFGTWRALAKKCINVQTGCAIAFSVRKVQISIPVSKLAPDAVPRLIMRLGDNYEWSAKTHIINITGETFDVIGDILSGKHV